MFKSTTTLLLNTVLASSLVLTSSLILGINTSSINKVTSDLQNFQNNNCKVSEKAIGKKESTPSSSEPIKCNINGKLLKLTAIYARGELISLAFTRKTSKKENYIFSF